jgi:hypothetical protein
MALTNPILDELAGLSPEAKTALLAARGAGAAPGPAAGAAAQPAAAGPPPMRAPSAQPPPSLIAPQLAQHQASMEEPAPSMTMKAPMGGSAPPPPPVGTNAPLLPAAASPNVVSQGQATLLGDKNELARKVSTGSGISQISDKITGSDFGQAHPFLGKLLGGAAQTLATLGNVGLDAVAPAVSGALPGTDYHHDRLVKQGQTQVAQDEANQEKEAQVADQASQTAERNAQAERLRTQADSLGAITLTPEQAEAAGVPEMAGVKLSQQTYQRLFGGTQATTAKKDIAAGNNETKVTTTGMNNDTSRANNADSNKAHESISDAADKTRVLVAQMHDATSRANNDNSVSHRGTVGGAFKVPADVTKRAALAANVNENSDAVDSLLAQRPEIVGAAGGRYTSVQQMIGSDDPAIAELGVRIHNIALASNGAHGVRSAQAILETENNLFNHFKSGPNAIHGALNATRSSMQTFLDDEKNFGDTGKRAGAGAGGPGDTTGGSGAQVPAEGATKKNAAGDTVIFKGGKWGPK